VSAARERSSNSSWSSRPSTKAVRSRSIAWLRSSSEARGEVSTGSGSRPVGGWGWSLPSGGI
jgi:hypothetical protein